MQMLGAGCHPLIGLRGGNVCGVLSEEQGGLCGRRASETERERERRADHAALISPLEELCFSNQAIENSRIWLYLVKGCLWLLC